MRFGDVFFRLWCEVRNNGAQLADEFVAGVTREDFIHPAWVWFRVLLSENFNHVALLEFSFKVDHFAVYDSASTLRANFAMEAIGKIKWHRAFRQVDNVTLWCVNKNFIGKEVKLELFLVNFFARSKFGGRFL